MQTNKSISFTLDNCIAINNLRKTQTRRIINPQPIIDPESGYVFTGDHTNLYKDDILHEPWQNLFIEEQSRLQVGDIIYVKENYYQYGRWVKNGLSKSGAQLWKFKPSNDEIIYAEQMDISFLSHDPKKRSTKKGIYRRLSMFMPKKYARYWIEITEVRIEHLQDICQEDAKAEGVYPAPHRCKGWTDPLLAHRDCYICPYKVLWNQLHGPQGNGWDKNPCVWVYTFKKVQKPG